MSANKYIGYPIMANLVVQENGQFHRTLGRNILMLPLLLSVLVSSTRRRFCVLRCAFGLVYVFAGPLVRGKWFRGLVSLLFVLLFLSANSCPYIGRLHNSQSNMNESIPLISQQRCSCCSFLPRIVLVMYWVPHT